MLCIHHTIRLYIIYVQYCTILYIDIYYDLRICTHTKYMYRYNIIWSCFISSPSSTGYTKTSNLQGLDREDLKVLQDLCRRGEERLKSLVSWTPIDMMSWWGVVWAWSPSPETNLRVFLLKIELMVGSDECLF